MARVPCPNFLPDPYAPPKHGFHIMTHSGCISVENTAFWVSFLWETTRKSEKDPYFGGNLRIDTRPTGLEIFSSMCGTAGKIFVRLSSLQKHKHPLLSKCLPLDREKPDEIGLKKNYLAVAQKTGTKMEPW